MSSKTYLRDPDFFKWTLRLAIPSAIQNLLAIGVNALNNQLTGHYFGEIEMSAVSQASTVFSIFEVLTFGFAASCSVLVAQYWGKRDMEKINKVISISLRLEALLGAIFTAIMFLAPTSVMSIMSNDPDVVALGSRYLLITAPTYFIYAIVNLLYSTYKSVEMVQVVLWGNSISYILNMLLSYVLIPARGTEGAAIASLIAKIADTVLVTVLLFTNKKINYTLKDLGSRAPELMGDYIKVTMPILGHELIWSIGNSMNQLITGRMNVVATGAYTIAITLSHLLGFVKTGLTGAAGAIVGKKIGEGNEEDAQKAASTFVIYTLIVSITMTAIFLLIKDWYIGTYNVTAEVKEMAKAMCYALVGETFCTGFDSVVLVSILRAGGSGKVGFWTDIVVMWGMGVVLGWLGLLVWNLSPAVVVALVKIDMPLKSLVSVYCVYKTKWIHNFAASDEETAEA